MHNLDSHQQNPESSGKESGLGRIYKEASELAGSTRKFLGKVLPFVAALPLAGTALGCSNEKAAQQSDAGIVTATPDAGDPFKEILALNKQIMGATVQLELHGTYMQDGQLVTGIGGCTGFVYDSRTIVTVRHCFGIDPRPTTLEKISYFAPEDEFSKISIKPTGKYRFVYPDQIMISPEMQKLAHQKYLGPSVWDVPAAVVFEKPILRGMYNLDFDSDGTVQSSDIFCFGRTSGYGTDEKWAFSHDVKSPYQREKQFFSVISLGKINIDIMTFDSDGQPGNSGGPIVRCTDKKVIALVYGGGRTTTVGVTFAESMGKKLKAEIKKAKAEKK